MYGRPRAFRRDEERDDREQEPWQRVVDAGGEGLEDRLCGEPQHDRDGESGERAPAQPPDRFRCAAFARHPVRGKLGVSHERRAERVAERRARHRTHEERGAAIAA